MTKAALALVLSGFVLGACGAGGPPIRPADPLPKQQGAISISGEGRFGVTAAN